MKRTPPVYTNLGMHFVNVWADKVALVQVEVNVRGLLAVHARRLCRSKRGMACLSGGAVRMTLATPEDREVASSVELEARAAAIETSRLQNEVDRLRHELKECGETVDILISNVNGLRDQQAAGEYLG